MIYEYKVPGERLVLTKEQFKKLSATWHDSFLPKWHDKLEFYKRDNNIIVHKFSSKVSVILSLICYPISLVAYGFLSFKELNKQIYRELHPKKTGRFTTNTIINGMDKIK